MDKIMDVDTMIHIPVDEKNNPFSRFLKTTAKKTNKKTYLQVKFTLPSLNNFLNISIKAIS